MPAAAWAARSGDPVLFAAGDVLPEATARRAEAPRQGAGLRARARLGDLGVRRCAAIAKVSASVHRVSGEDPVANAIAFARYADGNFGWNVNDPGHGFVLARERLAARRRRRGAALGLRHLGPVAAHRQRHYAAPGTLREYFLDVKPGYTTNPTRAFYNHVWVIGDQEAIDVNQQAEVNELAELAKIGGGE